MARNGTSTPADRLRSLIQERRDSLQEPPTRKALALVHPFPAPMSPHLAETIIKSVTEQDDVVLDPMAGSGTVPAAALALGRSCLAMDIDPLARMSIKVQCGRHPVRVVEQAGTRALVRAKVLLNDPKRFDRRFKSDFDDETRAFIDLWFPKSVRRGLMALWEAISKVNPKEARLPLKIAFSRVIIAKTAGTSYAIDLPHTRPHRDDDKEVPDPIEMFPQRIKELVRRLKDRRETLNGAELDIRSGDVRELPYRKGTVDLVLTSSPYANAIDYMRAHKFSLVWMGYSIQKLANVRAQMIGSEHGLKKSLPDLEWLDDRLPKVDQKVERRLAVLRRFFHDMDTVVEEIHRVLKPGGACVFVLGKSYLAGEVIDTPALIAEIAEKRDFEHIGTVYRDLNHDRRSLPFPRAAGNKQALGKRMDQEAIVALAR